VESKIYCWGWGEKIDPTVIQKNLGTGMYVLITSLTA
jgi:hypothetical protein